MEVGRRAGGDDPDADVRHRSGGAEPVALGRLKVLPAPLQSALGYEEVEALARVVEDGLALRPGRDRLGVVFVGGSR